MCCCSRDVARGDMVLDGGRVSLLLLLLYWLHFVRGGFPGLEAVGAPFDYPSCKVSTSQRLFQMGLTRFVRAQAAQVNRDVSVNWKKVHTLPPLLEEAIHSSSVTLSWPLVCSCAGVFD